MIFGNLDGRVFGLYQRGSSLDRLQATAYPRLHPQAGIGRDGLAFC